jgi:beta-glucanase (GH16 family)
MTVVTSFGKFAQRYGYCEARMKLPTTLGTWPAFWLMPDRGSAGGNEWQRQDSENGGMEFDIMEYLARFGPYHDNIAMHWAGHGKLHKATGTENIYFHPDKDGYVTSGLLIEPGAATFYCNGQMVGSWKDPRVGVTPEYILFTLPLGGSGTNGYVDDAKLPATFAIDWVRVCQRDDVAALRAYVPKAAVPIPTPAPP